MAKIDEISKKILFELDRNARQSSKDIAKKLKLKQDTVAYRIKQLEEDKIITSYYTLIDYSKLGFILIRLYLKFQKTTMEAEEDITNFFISTKSIFTVYKTEGDWDIALGFLVGSLKEFDVFYKSFKEKYKKFIFSENISVFLEYVHYFKNYLVDEILRDYYSISTGKSENVELNETDIKLLVLIAGNGKFSLLDVGKELNLSSMAVLYKIKKLEKQKVILGYKALIDVSKIGYEYYKIDLDIEDTSKIKSLQQWTRQQPNIIYEDRTVGGSDFEFDAELKNYDEFYNLIEEIKKRFPGILRTYKYYKARKIYKYVYFPEN